jgi:hypothetical protein
MSGSQDENALATGWHVSIGGTTYGPYDWPAVVAWAREGRFGADDLVWHAQLPGWVPAREVPGLFPAPVAPAPPPPGAVWSGGPYSPTAPARPGRRRLSGLSLVAICLAAVIVLTGAGIGTWLAVRDGGGTTSGTAGGNGETPVTGEVRVEKLSLAGRVVLPEGAALSPADLAVLSDTSEASCSTDGAFKVSAVHDQGARTALLVVNANRNPVLLAVAASSAADLEPSVASTARALVLYDPAFLSLPKAAYDLAAERLESHPGLPDLESALSDALRSDPSAPLDGDVHPEIYDRAAQIAADLLSGIVEIGDESTTAQPGALALLGRVEDASPGAASLLLAATQPASLVAAAGPGAFVDVIDDPEHATSEVTLVNTTWAAYTVGWTLTTPEGSSTGKAFLPRCAPWRVDVDSLKIGWPPVGFKLQKLVDVGNGQLSFQFRRNNDYMALDVCANLATLILGAGAESIRKVAGDGVTAAALVNTGGAFLQFSKELGALAGRMQGQSFGGCAKELGGFLAVSGGKVVLAVWPFLQNEIKEEFVTVLGTVITKRMAALAVLGYGSVDLIAQIKALGDPAIASYDTGGTQVAGLYPFAVAMELSVTPREAKTYVFEVAVTGVPPDLKIPLELVIDFGDGSKKEKVQPAIEGGRAVVAFGHTYGGEVPKKVRAVLQTLANKPALLASREAELTVKTVGPDELWFTVTFQEGGTYSQTVDGAPGLLSFDFLRRLDPINVYGNGRAHAEYSDPYGTCTFEGFYDATKKTLTGKYSSSYTMFDEYGSERSESGTGSLDGTLVYRPDEVPDRPNIFTMKGTIKCSGQSTYIDRRGGDRDDSYQKAFEINYSFVANGDTGSQ